MELFISGVFQALISGIASGAVLLIITKAMEKNYDDVKKAHNAEKELLEIKLQNMEDKINSIEEKHISLTEAFYGVKEKVIVMIQKQEEFKLRLFELIQTVEQLKMPDQNFGKVIRK